MLLRVLMLVALPGLVAVLILAGQVTAGEQSTNQDLSTIGSSPEQSDTNRHPGTYQAKPDVGSLDPGPSFYNSPPPIALKGEAFTRVGAVGELAQEPGSTHCPSLSTNFEGRNITREFTLGEPPRAVTFAGGNVLFAGNLALYHSGIRSWMVGPAATGTITFETPAQQVDLWYRDASDAVQSLLTFIDTNGESVATFSGTFNGPDAGWTHVIVTVSREESPIGRITLENPAGSSGDAVIDDFSFCAAPVKLEDPIPESIQKGSIPIKLTTVSSGLTAPNWGTFAPGSPDRLFVTDQVGTLWVIDLVTGDKAVFLDLSSRLVVLGIGGPNTFDERGLLGAAFHPDYAHTGFLYTYTSEPVGGLADFSTMPAGVTANHQTVILEWQVPDPANLASVVDPATVREVLRIDQPQFNHDGGALNFGPDGMLYIALGDGGSADDAGNGHVGGGNAQEPGNVLGAILRIDPMGSNSANGQYGIPQDNPFVGQTGFIDEIFAYGFRNPFRFSFDMGNGDMYIADVGQNDIEEIDLGIAGGNYGWNIKEGGFCFSPDGSNPGFVFDDHPCPVAPNDGLLTDPIAQYDHDEGIAIIGGFVYRGAEIPALQSQYIFGDYAGTPLGDKGRLFHLMGDQILEFPLFGRDNFGMFLLGFGQDSNGEVYVLANDLGIPFGETGVVFRVEPGPVAELSQALFQDPKDGATGVRVGINRIFDPSNGNEVAALLENFQAQLVYDGSCVNVLGFRDIDFSITDHTIDNAAGIATFGGISAGGEAVPADLGHILTQLVGDNQVTCQVTMEVKSLIDDGGNNTGVVPPALSQTHLRGDARADEVINIADALYLAQYLAEMRPACTGVVDTTCLQSVNAASVQPDVAFAQKTITDALFIAQHLVGLRDEFYNMISPPAP